jgi:hypothetical protein
MTHVTKRRVRVTHLHADVLTSRFVDVTAVGEQGARTEIEYHTNGVEDIPGIGQLVNVTIEWEDDNA